MVQILMPRLISCYCAVLIVDSANQDTPPMQKISGSFTDMPASLRVRLILLILLLVLPVLIYSPGLHGPFLLDDYPNIIKNEAVHIQNLSFVTLHQAANSLISGILGRPLAAISFAFNYYLSHDANNPYGFKLFNVVIHTLNGLLIFWFLRLLFLRLQAHPAQPLKAFTRHSSITLLAGLTALLWVCHPIQLTSVLYVVQRMTSMAALFMLLALIAYLKARTAQQTRAKWIWLVTIPVWSVLALLSKETGFLLPLYILILELVLFPKASPWKYWPELKPYFRGMILAGVGLLAVLLIAAAVHYSLPGYQYRDFTLMQRLLTEARVLVFYIGQILIPRLSSFGLYHDDFSLSHTLLQPWTTLPAVLSITALLLLALLTLRRQPLLSLGLLWFFTSHALESTVYPFELIYEHRNYLASLGILFIIIQALLWLETQYRDKRIWLLMPILILVFAISTTIRSYEWRDLPSLLLAHVENHPESSHAWASLSNVYVKNNNYKEAIASLDRAILLDPREPGYYIYLYMNITHLGLPLPEIEKNRIIEAIRSNPQTTMLTSVFDKMNRCIDSSCKDLQNIYEVWLRAALSVMNSPRFRYYLGNNLAAQGKLKKGLKYINLSIKQAPHHLSPYIGRIDVLLKQGNINEAKKTYNTLKSMSIKLFGVLTNKVLETGRRISSYKTQASPQPRTLPVT
ncbi:MAG TPA: tetratricopeptide repeat protein [Gammaproteobacteria bacterium]|nr:tetratricopeptide repeat protein [Gammaproteobacteria bacterium]